MRKCSQPSSSGVVSVGRVAHITKQSQEPMCVAAHSQLSYSAKPIQRLGARTGYQSSLREDVHISRTENNSPHHAKPTRLRILKKQHVLFPNPAEGPARKLR